MTSYGYARVSARDQHLTGQVAELTAAGCNKVFREKVSGAKSDRTELCKLLKALHSRRKTPHDLPAPYRARGLLLGMVEQELRTSDFI